MHSKQTDTPSGTRSRRGVNPQPLQVVEIADALLRMQTAAQVTGLSEATLYRKAKSDPTFPKLIKVGIRCTRIRAGELTAWMAAQSGA